MYQASRMPTYNQIELEFRILVFENGGRPEITAKTLGAGTRTKNNLAFQQALSWG